MCAVVYKKKIYLFDIFLNYKNFLFDVLNKKYTYTEFFFISPKIFVHLTNLKLFYRGLQYLKIFVCLFHFIEKSDKNINKSYLLILQREVYLAIVSKWDKQHFFYIWPLHNCFYFWRCNKSSWYPVEKHLTISKI